MTKMSMLRTLMGLAASAMLINLAMATNFTVGGSNGGWDTTTNLQGWASSQAFSVGDNLIFQYAPSHDVVEVTKADYDSCQTSNPLQMYTGGTTIIPLAAPGKRYFICGTSGHCSQGMKVEVDTLAASALPPASPPAATPITPPPVRPVTPPASPPVATPITPPPVRPVTPPASLPPPESAAPPAANSPTSAPTVSPPPLVSSLTPSSGVLESPANSPLGVTSPPPPSLASKIKLMAGSTMVFGFVAMMLLTL